MPKHLKFCVYRLCLILEATVPKGGGSTAMLPASLSKALILPWTPAEKEQILAYVIPCTTNGTLHSQLPFTGTLKTGSEHRHTPHFFSSCGLSACREDVAVPGNVVLPHAHCQPVPYHRWFTKNLMEKAVSYSAPPQGSPGPLGLLEGDWALVALIVPTEPVLQKVEEHFVYISTKYLRCRGCACSEGSQCHTQCLCLCCWLHIQLCVNPLLYFLGKSSPGYLIFWFWMLRNTQMHTSSMHDFTIYYLLQYLFNTVSWPLRLLLHFTLKLYWQQCRTAVRNCGLRFMWII